MPFQKIKIVEGIDLIRTDIASTFESGYIGKVLNDYDNKLLLVTAINAYIRQMEGDVLDKTAENLCEISLEGQRTYLQSIGTDTADLTDMEILKANTDSQVFLEAQLTFCDAMEDLSLKISMQQEEDLSCGCFTGKPHPLRLLCRGVGGRRRGALQHLQRGLHGTAVLLPPLRPPMSGPHPGD